MLLIVSGMTVFNLALMIKGVVRAYKLGPNANLTGRKDLKLAQFKIRKPKLEEESLLMLKSS